MTFLYDILLVPKLVCRNICERIYSKKIFLIKAITLLERNTVEDVKFTCIIMKVYFVLVVVGMQLGLTPSNREGKERLDKKGE